MWPFKGCSRSGYLFIAKRCAMSGGSALLVRRTEADYCLAANQCWPARLALCLLDGIANSRGVVPIDRQDLPAIGLETLSGIIRKPFVYLAVYRDAVVIIEHYEFAQIQRAREGADFMGDAFHQAAVTGEDIGVVVDDLVILAIKLRAQCLLRDRHAHRIGEALP